MAMGDLIVDVDPRSGAQPRTVPLAELTGDQLAQWMIWHDSDAARRELADRFIRTGQIAGPVEKGRRGPGQRYRHGWVPIVETLTDLDRDYQSGRLNSTVHADGTISLFHEGGTHEQQMGLHVEDVPDLVTNLDQHLDRHEAGNLDDITYVPLASGDEVAISSPTPHEIEVQFGDGDPLTLTPDEVEQFTADLEELAAQHHPELVDTQPVSADLAVDLYSHDRVGLRDADADLADLLLSRAEVDDVADALSKLDARYHNSSQEWDEHGEPLHVDERELPGGITVRWRSDNSAVIARGDMEQTIPAGQTQATVAALGVLFARLGPVLTPKGHRLVRGLVKAAGVVKVEQGTAGQYRARHLRRWFEHGEGGEEIGWGTPGDFDRCVALAGKHMTRPQGYCNLRHKGALGYYPATHAAMERAGKGKP